MKKYFATVILLLSLIVFMISCTEEVVEPKLENDAMRQLIGNLR